MKRIDFDDMDAVMSMKGKGNSRRYAFNDFSDGISIENKTAKILRDRRKQKLNHIKHKDMGQPMLMSEPLRKLRATMGKPQLAMLKGNVDNIHCNTTHIWDGVKWTVLVGILTISQVKDQYNDVIDLMYSKDNTQFGALYTRVNNTL